jgi:NADH-quinone oxidoreductase subunit L
LHLLTHAFFKALLFLGSGSVIYGCHHEQDMTKMGGLFPKMKITALTMLVGVLAIAGIPLFSGWYSKDGILGASFGFAFHHHQHALLFLLPLATAGLTTFYMFRMWFMTFAGPPRDHHVHEHAHESPWTMTVPLIVLAVFSVMVAWGNPIWDPERSWLEHELHDAQPTAVQADFGTVLEHGETADAAGVKMSYDVENMRLTSVKWGGTVGLLALAVVALGLVFAALIYYFRVLDPADAKEQFPALHRFLIHKWYFDELYSALLVRPALVVAGWLAWFDLVVIDGFIHFLAWFVKGLSWVNGEVDKGMIDGLVNGIAAVVSGVGGWLRNVQTGYLRSYVLFLALAAAGIFVALAYFMTRAFAG